MKEKEHLYLFSERGIVDFLSRLDCPHVTFEPAIFAHYDMFLVASPQPLTTQENWQVSSLTSHPPEARLVRALLDTDDALRASRLQNHDTAQQLAASEADRAARLDLIHAQGSQIGDLEAERVHLQSELDQLRRPWFLARAAVERIRGVRASLPSAGTKRGETPTPVSDEVLQLATAMSSRVHDRSLFPLWEEHGFHVTPVHFYAPIPQVASLPESLWQRPSEMPGVDINEAGQLAFLRDTCVTFKTEYDAFPHQPTGATHEYYFDQPMFRSVDAEVLHCMVRSYRPNRLIEVGSGFSTLVSAAALAKNAAEGHPGEMIAIEPYPGEVLSKGMPSGCALRRQRVQDVDSTLFESLGENDILFIDSSHVLRLDSDVRFLFLEVLPRLQPGVVVHVHDIFLPQHYPRQWVVEEHRFWTEQYLLQAFLAFNPSFEILWAGSYMRARHAERLREAFASYESSVWPGSFWFRRLTGPR
jgi:hypothetical protein